jgi:hypothetical protein
LTEPNPTPTLAFVMSNSEHYLSDIEFIIAVEDGWITPEQLWANAQRFYNGGTWKHLQGAWQRQIEAWLEWGIIE